MKQLRNITVKFQAKKKTSKLRNGLTKGLIFCSHFGFKIPPPSHYLLNAFTLDSPLGISRYKPGNLLILRRTAPPF